MKIELDKKDMQLKIQVGALEEYKPTKNVKRLVKMVSELKDRMEEFMEEEVNPELERIQALIDKEHKKYFEEDTEAN